MSNSVDPDETAHYEPSHQALRCLQKPIIACGRERVKENGYNMGGDCQIVLPPFEKETVLKEKNKSASWEHILSL